MAPVSVPPPSTHIWWCSACLPACLPAVGSVGTFETNSLDDLHGECAEAVPEVMHVQQCFGPVMLTATALQRTHPEHATHLQRLPVLGA